LTRLHANESRRLVVSIANNELPLLKFVLDQVGAGKITRKRAYSEKHAPSYCYTVTSRQALCLLRQLKGHLRSYKQGRAALALARYESLTPRNGKYTAAKRASRDTFERDMLSLTARQPSAEQR